MRRSIFVTALLFLGGSVFAAGCNGTRPSPTPTALRVACDATALSSLGQQAHCTAQVTLTGNQTEDRTAAAQWSTSDPSKLTVNAGTVTAVAAGGAVITATVSGVTGQQTISVNVGCAFSLTPNSGQWGATGGPHDVTVNADPAGCTPAAWTASSTSPDLTIAPLSGTGTARVTVTAVPNTTLSTKTLTATIAGQAFTAKVSAVCRLSFAPVALDAPNTWNVPAALSERQMNITSNEDCGGVWKATPSASWLSATPDTGNRTPASARVFAAANAGPARAGLIAFEPTGCASPCTEGVTITVHQAAATATLSLTLLEGEQLSGPYRGTARGPNGFTCSQTGATTVCPPLTVTAGTSVAIVVTLDSPTFPGPSPIFRATGCDTLTLSTCTVLMNTDRAVSISVGCEVFCGGSPGAEALDEAESWPAADVVVTPLPVVAVKRPALTPPR